MMREVVLDRSFPPICEFAGDGRRIIGATSKLSLGDLKVLKLQKRSASVVPSHSFDPEIVKMNTFATMLSAFFIAACSLPVVGCAADGSDGTVDPDTDQTENNIMVADGADEVSEAREPSEAPTDPGAVHTLGAAPSCVERGMEGNYRLHVHNGCRTEQWLKVKISKMRDSDCFRLTPTDTAHVTWRWPGGFDGLVTC
ncbi:hypothetical protein LZC95_13565 [Pendulispora brunnea]|uniref:Secreted protein n=1 Tax=Pendulispora brunnea TaxID=2905690 RepID=A0ABZ2KH05_9BACT